MPVSVLRTSKSFSVALFSLKSKESTWLKAPANSKKITFFALPRGVVLRVGSARSCKGQTDWAAAAAMPAPPNRSNSRREGISSPMVASFFIGSS